MLSTIFLMFLLGTPGQRLGPTKNAPTLTSVFPAHVLQGASSPVVITVTGSNFTSGNSTVDWNGATLSTTYISSTQMTASIPSSDFVTAGTNQITVVNSGAHGGTSSSHNFYVVSPVAINTTSLPQAIAGTSYSFTFTATGGTLPYTWSISSGQLPAGLTLDVSTGVVSGTPSSAIVSSFTVTVVDSTNLLG